MTPAFEVRVDGRRDITEAIASRLLSLSISDRAGWEADTCRIEIEDDGTLDLPKRGVKLDVRLGFGSDLATMGSYTVDEVGTSAPPPRSRSPRARQTSARRSRSLGRALGPTRPCRGSPPKSPESTACARPSIPPSGRRRSPRQTKSTSRT